MDRAELSSAIIAEMQALVGAALETMLPELWEADLLTMEQRVQQVGRRLMGCLIERVAAQRDQALPRPVCCAACGGRLRRRERTRHLLGLVGDYALQRGYYWCGACGQSQVPVDEALGLGQGELAPGLARVVAWASMQAPFAQAVAGVQEAVGVTVSDETARRTTEHLGAVAEAQTQAAIGRAQRGAPVWTAAEVQAAENTTILAVEVDGVLVHREEGWHEMKVLTVAPLGPAVQTDPQTKRTHLRWGAASYDAGVEEAEDFWWRVYTEALRRGLGTPSVRTVVVLGDGAHWIWQRAAAFLGAAGTEVVEIVDIFHAYDYLWAVGNAVFGAGPPQAVASWVEPVKDRLYLHGPAPVLAALRALTPATEEARTAIAAAQSYFTTHAARMDYPRFVARQFPIGSGAVESSCKCLVEARLKHAGMRWATAGCQALASLRAVQRSGRWTAFWQTQPHRQRKEPRAHPNRRAAAAAPPAAAPPAPAAPPVVAVHVAAPRSSPRPKPAARQRPLLLPRSA